MQIAMHIISRAQVDQELNYKSDFNKETMSSATVDYSKPFNTYRYFLLIGHGLYTILYIRSRCQNKFMHALMHKNLILR